MKVELFITEEACHDMQKFAKTKAENGAGLAVLFVQEKVKEFVVPIPIELPDPPPELEEVVGEIIGEHWISMWINSGDIQRLRAALDRRLKGANDGAND